MKGQWTEQEGCTKEATEHLEGEPIHSATGKAMGSGKVANYMDGTRLPTETYFAIPNTKQRQHGNQHNKIHEPEPNRISLDQYALSKQTKASVSSIPRMLFTWGSPQRDRQTVPQPPQERPV